MPFSRILVQLTLSIFLLHVSSTHIELFNLGSSYVSPLNVGNQTGTFIIDTLSEDIVLKVNVSAITAVACTSQLYDLSAVTSYSDNCSYTTYHIGFGDENITSDVLEATDIVYEDPALHQWENSSGMFGMGYKTCTGDTCFNQSRASFHTILESIYNTTVFGLDLNNNTTPSFLDIGSLSVNYASVFEWGPRQIASFPQSYEFLLHDLQFCDVDIIANMSTNWQGRLDTASACLTLPAELFNSVLSWLDLYVAVEQLDSLTTEDILSLTDLPVLSFSLESGGNPMLISLEDLVVNSSELVNLPNAPTIQLKNSDGSTVSSGLGLCMLAGSYADNSATTASPQQIVLGSLALRSLYVGVDVNASNPRVGFANKKQSAGLAGQCATPVTCSGDQYTHAQQNQCRNPDCRKYFYAALNEDTHVCEYDTGSIVVGVLFVIIFASCEIIAFFVSQYTSYMVIPDSSRKFSVDVFTLKIGEMLTLVVDKFVLDVLGWAPHEHAATATDRNSLAHDDEVDVSEGDVSGHHMSLFLNFSEPSTVDD